MVSIMHRLRLVPTFFLLGISAVLQLQPSLGEECCSRRSLCCQNGGQCRSETIDADSHNNPTQIGQYEHEFCECPEGWGGDDCSASTVTSCCGGGAQEDGTIKPPLCCQNGGTCKSTSARDYCECSNGWGGRHCSMECCKYRDLCCYNGAHCVEESANDIEHGEVHIPVENCECTAGWAGKSCVFPVTVCPDGDTQCFHGADCQKAEEGSDSDSEYVCDCSSVEGGAVAGDMCQFNATTTCHEEKADTHFCTNGGECELIHGPGDETPHQGCICTRPFFGPHCEYKFTTFNDDSSGTSVYKSTYKDAGPKMSMKAITGIYTLCAFLFVGGWTYFQTSYKGTAVEEYPGSSGIELS